MHPDHGETEKKFRHEIAVADGIETVLADLRELELARDRFPVEHDRRTGNRSGAERQNVGAPSAINDPTVIALERFDVREKVMAEHDWLRALEMRVAGQDRVLKPLRQIEQSALEFAQSRANFGSFGFHIKPQIERDLIVPAPRGMKLRPGRTNPFCECRLD